MTFELIKASPVPVEVSAELADYALCVLPPIYGQDMFAMGEPYSGATDGTGASYYWFAQRAGKYYGFLGSRRQALAAFQEVKQ